MVTCGIDSFAAAVAASAVADVAVCDLVSSAELTDSKDLAIARDIAGSTVFLL